MYIYLYLFIFIYNYIYYYIHRYICKYQCIFIYIYKYVCIYLYISLFTEINLHSQQSNSDRPFTNFQLIIEVFLTKRSFFFFRSVNINQIDSK